MNRHTVYAYSLKIKTKLKTRDELNKFKVF